MVNRDKFEDVPQIVNDLEWDPRAEYDADGKLFIPEESKVTAENDNPSSIGRAKGEE